MSAIGKTKRVSLSNSPPQPGQRNSPIRTWPFSILKPHAGHKTGLTSLINNVPFLASVFLPRRRVDILYDFTAGGAYMPPSGMCATQGCNRAAQPVETVAGGAYMPPSGMCATQGCNRAGQPVQTVIGKLRLVPQAGVPGVFVHVSDHIPVVGAGLADLLFALPECLYTRIVIAYQRDVRRREGSRADWMRWGCERMLNVCLCPDAQLHGFPASLLASLSLSAASRRNHGDGHHEQTDAYQG
ncbi:MAG: hypothetical protein ABSA70_16265, partial [Terriglobia bacterium]